MKKIFTLFLVLLSLSSIGQSTTFVISQVYGAGGNTGSVYNADYVELHNISTGPLSLSGFSIQYSSATNTGPWTGIFALPATTVPAGAYYLIQMSVPSTTVGIVVPFDVTTTTAGAIAMSATNGKVALVNGTTALNGCPGTTNIIDLLGYGTANCSETAPAAALSSANGALRKNSGCTETDNNGADFTVEPPLPRNLASPIFICSGGPPSPSISAGTVTDFGNVLIGSNSASQSFNISGANLTGAPGSITITSPSTDFQVSNDNSTWGATTTVAYTAATLTSTPVYVRFSPQTAGPKSGNVTITGGGISTAVTVAVSGNGVDPTIPAITTTSLSAFGAICVNNIGGPATVTLTGSNLTTADVTVAALAGYSYATNAGGPFSNSLTLTHAAGAYSQVIFVQFTPTTVGSFDGNIVVNGGGLATPVNIAASGSGVNTTPTVITGSASAITNNSATLSGTISANGCSPVTAYGIEYSTVNGFTSGIVAASTNLSGGSFSSNVASLLPGITYYYKAFATNSGGTAYGNQLSFITSSPPPATLTSTPLPGFGNICIGETMGPDMITLSGINLNAGDITVGPKEGYTFATTSTGPFTPSLAIPQTGGTFSQDIYVNFTPDSVGNFNEDIPASGGGATAIGIVAAGTGVNTPPTVITGDTISVSFDKATIFGKIDDAGCSLVEATGIELSGINGFENGQGIRYISKTQIADSFVTYLASLVPNTEYYYKAYAINAGGIAYGEQRKFKTGFFGEGLIIYSNPIPRGGSLHFSYRNLKPGHYAAKIYNSIGQLVYQRDMVVQVNFINEIINLPSNLGIGRYDLRIENYEFRVHKAFMIR